MTQHSPAAPRGAAALLALLALLAALTACGIRPSGAITGLHAPNGPVENTSPSLFWVANGKVVRVSRPQGSLTGQDVVELLARGPTDEEKSRGLTSEVPPEATTIVADRVASGLDVRLSVDIGQLSTAAVQQIVCTLLGVQDVGTVNLRSNDGSLDSLTCA